MKTSNCIITLPLIILAVAITTNFSRAQTVASPLPAPNAGQPAPQMGTYQISERDANSQMWQRVDYEPISSGKTVPHLHKYIELSTGLNHMVNGQWVASKEEIDRSPDGNSAAATNGQHQAYFPGDIAQGVIELVTPDGLKLQSRPIGLGYDDGSKTVLIGVLAHSAGELLGSNQVIYPNAFDGVAASLRYRYTKSGFEQDIVLEAQPPTPESFGFNPQTTRLQVLTEFFDPPQPTVTATTVATAAGDLADDNLDFGMMQMVPGKAFLLSTNSLPVAVNKQWVLAGGRQLLVEEVPVMSIADELLQLPLPQTTSIKPNPPLNVVSAKRLLPAQRLVTVPGRHPVRVAQAAPSSRGLVLDYVMMTSQTNYTFQGDTTYYISGTVNLKGTSLIEGGTVIKYTNNASINVAYPATVQTLTAAYRPAIFTAMDDNTVGETINGSTGNPISGAYANPALYLGKSQTLSNLRIAYAQQALTIGDTVTFYNIQMYNCMNGASVTGATANFYNAMFVNMGNCFNNLNYATVNVQNGTFCNIHNYLVTCSTCCFTVGIANSILAWVNNLIYSTSQNYTLTGNNNGFYVNGFSAFGMSQVTSSSNPFQTMGAGSCYLANGCAFTNAGTTNIDATLLASLAQKTTCPPSLLTNTTISSNTTLSPQAPRDIGAPDLGYHYDPIDYITELYAVTNATLTIASGTVIACYNDAGIWLQDGSAISSIGTPTAPIWFTYYLSVQEQPILLGAYTNFYCALNIYPGYFGSASPNGIFQFSKFSRPPGVGYQFYDDCSYDNGYSKNSFQNLWIQDCELWNGYNVFSGAASSTAAVKNTLFARSPVYAYDRSITSYSLSFSNNLFWKISGGNSSVQIYLYTSAPWFLFNNDFDSCAIFSESSTTNGYNAYLNCSGDARLYPPNANDIVTNVGLAYQTGPLGNFYQPTNSRLIKAGSKTADQVGLYHYTVTTNEVIEGTNIVSIGYHYVAVGTNGMPIDSNGDGIPDYLEDANGNGVDDTGETPWDISILQNPMSQEVEDGDTVTFAVVAVGNGTLTYQWTWNGTNIFGATNSSYTINDVMDGYAGAYAVIISNGINSIGTPAAQLTTDSQNPLGPWQTEFINLIPVFGQRQNYTFRSGFTYYINSSISLYGNTTIEGDAVLKFDSDNSTNSSLVIMGGLTCTTEPYNPAILTSIDDDAAGQCIASITTNSSGYPQTSTNGTPYLDMTYAQSNSISNLRVCFAGWGVTTPIASRKLDIWDCQFVQCNYGIVNLVPGSSTNSLHNVLFAACGAAVGASTNSVSIEGEQVTADVGDFCLANSTPSRIALTNSIVWGNSLTASNLSTITVAFNPDATNFVSEGDGNYYLAANSSLRHSGTPGISPRLQTELQHKTTYSPVPIAVYMQITGNMTLSPQAPRYTNGAPDFGYYYDALDYSVAAMILSGGNVTVLPGTAIAVRNEYIPAYLGYTPEAFWLQQGSSFISHGTPAKPNIFTAERMVQELPETEFSEYQLYEYGWWWGGAISFVTDFIPGDNVAPTLDFRFSKFYLPANDYHIWSGLDEYAGNEMSPDSSMYLSLQDCSVHGGRINLGYPDSYDAYYYDPGQVYGPGAVTWVNNSFENVTINLDPTYYEYGYGVNCDMQVQAYNNLFRGGLWLHLQPIPATAGNWEFKDNLFDRVDFIQDANRSLDYDYNGYWRLTGAEQAWDWWFYPGWWVDNTNQLQITMTGDGFTDGGHEQVLTTAPPYQAGPFGNFYLPNTTPLYGAGSTNAAGLGLYHYTTRLDQKKEGDEASGHMVNIGVHYVAATNGVPKDSDNDGIPDYVEDANGNGQLDNGETSPTTAMTIDGVLDSTNSVYDDIDLSGDGLVGRIKKALGMNPFDTSNPLALTQIITGDEPGFITFKVPISYASVDYNSTNQIGKLSLSMDGVPLNVSYEPDDSGLCLLTWNTTFSPPGFHVLQPEFDLNINIATGPTLDSTVITAMGPPITFANQNCAQFDPFYCQYDDSHGAILYATTPTCPNASYTIELQTTNGNHIKTITGSTSSGEISEPWDLTDDNGNTITNDSVKAIFNVTLLDPGSSTETEILNRMADQHLPVDGDFTVAYCCDGGGDDQNLRNCMQWTVVDQLIGICNVTFCYDHRYNSTFDTWSDLGTQPGNPGHLATQTDADNLLANLANGNIFQELTKNFYFFGHGNPIAIGTHDIEPVSIGVGDVARALGNELFAFPPGKLMPGKLRSGQAYRFVFLDACSTAHDPQWAHAFGVFDRITTKKLANWPEQAQAFVGWEGAHKTPGNKFDMANCYSVFWAAWQSGLPLDRCIWYCSQDYPPPPIGFEDLSAYNFGPKYQLWPQSAIQNGSITGDNPPHIRVYGYSGITRTGYQPGYDNSIYYK